MPRLALLLLLALPAASHALCTSDDVPEPAAVLERFISAGCAPCWRDAATPRAAPDTLALDWILPARQAPDAPLSVVALDEALDRLYALGQPVPERSGAVATRRTGDPVALRLAQGDAFNDYIGTTMEMRSPGRESWHTWLLLVEQLPAGVEGSPVPRNLVRNVFRPDWGKVMKRAPAPLAEARTMQLHEGDRPDRLRLVALVQDARGRMRAIRQTECHE